jgi:hypothetical protein
MSENLPAKPKRGRPAKIDILVQTREVAAMLLTNRPRSEIIEHCCNTYGVQEATVPNIITRAYKYISETHAIDKEGLVHQHIQFYYDIYRMASQIGDSRGCVQALNSIEKLLKLSNDVLVQNNSLTVNLKDLTLTELKELLKVND